jgi:carbon-monoxide dehydrogenase medium subunit
VLPPFELLVPENLEEAVEALAELGEEARVLAGGTDLLPQMRGGQVKPRYVMDIKRLNELKGFGECSDGWLRIGALTTHRALEVSPLIREKFAVLHDGVSQVGSVQIRNRGTVGGNICNALPSADSVAPLLALGARLRIRGPVGWREVALEDFFLGPRQTVLERGEVLTDIFVPPSPGTGAYIKYTRRRAMDLAQLGVAVYLERDGDGRCRQVRIALATAAPTPMRATQAEESLRGRVPTPEALREAAEIASREARPRTSWRGTEEYRRHLIRVLLPQAARLALQRAECP